MRKNLTLGKLIAELEALPPDTVVRFDFPEDKPQHPGEPDSYRGYYEDLAFESCNEPITASALLLSCKNADIQTHPTHACFIETFVVY